VTKIPYCASFIRFQRSSGQESSSVPIHDEIPFFDVIQEGVKLGFRHFFRRMPKTLNDYRVLCETLEFLCVDVLSGRNIRTIMNDLKSGKSEWGPGERVSKTLARDSAFRLLYKFLLTEFESDITDSNLAYNAAIFVISHPGIFKYSARGMVREAYKERFFVSANQHRQLEKWALNSDSCDDEEADYLTTESEETKDDWNDIYYDSD
jgi:hypothetical protein